MSRQNGRRGDPEFYTIVDDELYDELAELTGERVVHFVLWEDSLVDALEEVETAPDTQELFDLDLYLECGVYFELYDVSIYVDPDEEPLTGQEAVSHRLLSLVNRGLSLDGVAVDEEDLLVLVVGQSHAPEEYDSGSVQPDLYLDVGGWLVNEWDELP